LKRNEDIQFERKRYAQVQRRGHACVSYSFVQERSMTIGMEHTIKTNRLVLKPLCEADIDFLQKLIARPEAYFYDPDMQESPDDVIKNSQCFIDKSKSLPYEGGIQWIVKLADDNIGEVHVQCNWEKTSEWEFGYHFLKEYWGKGYATEALKTIIPYIFTNFNIHRLVAFTNSNNKESIALLRRVGLYEEARLREVRMANGVYCDEMVYSLLKREFLKRSWRNAEILY
jgi:RimJ/RimL family protein N-acetyltransferase